MKNIFTVRKICFVALFTALNTALSSFGIPVPGAHIYLNDTAICFASLILDPFSAFIVGGVGAFLGDFFFYPAPMFVSLITHGLQAAAISAISGKKDKIPPIKRALLAISVGVLIMVTGYTLGRAFVYSTPQYAISGIPFEFLQAITGAVLGTVLLYKTPLKKQVMKYIIVPQEKA